MKLEFQWVAKSKAYELALTRRAGDPVYAVTFDQRARRTDTQHTARAAVEVHGEQLVTFCLARMLHRGWAIDAAAERTLECTLSLDGSVIMDGLHPYNAGAYINEDEEDEVSHLEATRQMISEVGIADGLLFLCTNSAT